jgi:hypothetical protein
VSNYEPLLPAAQAWELELSFLVNCLSLGNCQFQFTTKVVLSVHQRQLGCPVLTQAGSAQGSAPPPPKGDEIFPLCIWPAVLFKGFVICPPAGLAYVVFYRADDVVCSPGRVVVTLGRIGSALGQGGQAAV